jgi:hypothetical protein
MATLAFLRTDALTALFILVCGAIAWRLIWAILVTPRLNQIPPLFGRKESVEHTRPSRVLIREHEPEPEPEFQCIEVITPREAFPSRSSNEVTPRPALPGGNRSIVRKHVR